MLDRGNAKSRKPFQLQIHYLETRFGKSTGKKIAAWIMNLVVFFYLQKGEGQNAAFPKTRFLGTRWSESKVDAKHLGGGQLHVHESTELTNEGGALSDMTHVLVIRPESVRQLDPPVPRVEPNAPSQEQVLPVFFRQFPLHQLAQLIPLPRQRLLTACLQD